MNHKGTMPLLRHTKGTQKYKKVLCVLCVFVVRFVLYVLKDILAFSYKRQAYGEPNFLADIEGQEYTYG